MNKLLFSLLLLLITSIAYGQPRTGTLFKAQSYNEFKKRFKIIPVNLDEAMTQIDSSFTEAGRRYFINLPETLAVVQFASEYYMVTLHWKMGRPKHPHLINYFLKNGSTGNELEILRIIIAALHRKLKDIPYTIAELSEHYSSTAYVKIVESLRDVNPKDTVYRGWHVSIGLGKAHGTYFAIFEVVDKNPVTNMLTLKIIRLTRNNIDVDSTHEGYYWKLGQLVEWKNGDLITWKEGIHYW